MSNFAKRWNMRVFFLVVMVCGSAGVYAADSPAAPEDSSLNITSTLVHPSMYPLYFCSILLVAIMIEKTIELRDSRIMDRNSIREAIHCMANGNIQQAKTTLEQSKCLINQAWSNGLSDCLQDNEAVKDALTSSCHAYLKTLQKRLSTLSTLSVISPLFGLLGTVIGMIICFMHISLAGGTDKAQLAGGIGFALFTTAAGLMIAIPGIISNRFFNTKILAYADETEEYIERASKCHLRFESNKQARPAGDETVKPKGAK